MWPTCVRANLLAADSEITGPVNIGHGQETSVRELIQALNDVSPDRPLPEPIFEAERPGEVRRSCLDVTRAREELGGRRRSRYETACGRSWPASEGRRRTARPGSAGRSRTAAAGASSSPAALTTATTASPNVASSAMTSTQNVQGPTQLGRHSDARENAVDKEPSSV